MIGSPKGLISAVFILCFVFFLGLLLYTYFADFAFDSIFSIPINHEDISNQNKTGSEIISADNGTTGNQTIEEPIPNGGVIGDAGPFFGLAKGDRNEALKISSDIKGVYMTEHVANAKNSATFREIKRLLLETELNGVVLDIKEADGPSLYSSLANTIKDLHSIDTWVVARICAFRDSSQINSHPDWYIKKTNPDFPTSTVNLALWQDRGGNYWLDPANKEVQKYIIDFSKKAIDFGFDELQFDYIRFPSDGDVSEIFYPSLNEEKTKTEIIGDFFEKLSTELRDFSSSTILSVDLFGDAAIRHQLWEIGQSLTDTSNRFDYVSFMLYPSHFYNGFEIGADTSRNLPAVYFPYTATDTSRVVSSRPYEVISRSVFSASDYLKSLNSQTKIRPWLQNFNLGADTSRGIYYDAGKIRSQISAAEDSGSFGWLLWSPSNIYNESALIKD